MAPLKEISEFTEIDFSRTALIAISEVFTEKEKDLLDKTKVMKLITFAADRLDFPLTRGWFRYGYYAPTAQEETSLLFGSQKRLGKLVPPQVRCGENTLEDFKMVVSYLKPFFLVSRTKFDRWIHEEMAPEPYRRYYKCEKLFFEKLTYIERAVLNNRQRAAVPANFSEIVTEFERSLDFVDNQQALEYLHDYVDFWELLILRIQNRGITTQMKPIASELVKIYKKYLRPALTPYEKTLVGMNAEQKKKEFRQHVRSNLIEFSRQLDFYKNSAKRDGSIATLEEIRDDLKQRVENWDDEKRKNFERTLLEYTGGYA